MIPLFTIKSSDLTAYFDLVQTLRDKELSLRFETLKKFANVFIVKGDNVKQTIIDLSDIMHTGGEEKCSGAENLRIILGFAGMREDWSKIKKKVLKEVDYYRASNNNLTV